MLKRVLLIKTKAILLMIRRNKIAVDKRPRGAARAKQQSSADD